MPFTDLLVLDRTRTEGAPDAQVRPGPTATGVFTSGQSLVTFPLATCIVATVARAARTIGRTDFDSIATPLMAALVVGAVIFGLTVLDPRSRPNSLWSWIASVGIAAVNSLVLFAAALGIEKF